MKTAKEVVEAIRQAGTQKPSFSVQASTKLIDWGFNTFKEPALENQLKRAMDFVNEMASGLDGRWLTLCGPSGVGKTHLGSRIWDWWQRWGKWKVGHGKSGSFLTSKEGYTRLWRKLVSRLKEGAWGELEDLLKSDFLIIDDLFAAYDNSGFALSIADRICDERQGKWTLFTTNKLLDEIADEEQRIASRMKRGLNVVVETVVKDYATRDK